MKSKRVYLNAYGPANLFDLTGYLSDFINESELISGLVFVFSIGSTGALIQTEKERIFSDWIMSFIPFETGHRHSGNAFAHLRSTILGSDSTLPVENKNIKSASKLHLLENTAGRKNRPLELRAIGQFAGGGRLNMKVASNTLPIEANGWIDIVELSQVANDVVLKSGISDGFLHVESLAKRSAISTTEYESALLNDTADFISQMVGSVREDLRANIAAALIGPSMIFPIRDSRLELGTWQQPVFIDLGEPGPKELFFQAVGM